MTAATMIRNMSTVRTGKRDLGLTTALLSSSARFMNTRILVRHFSLQNTPSGAKILQSLQMGMLHCLHRPAASLNGWFMHRDSSDIVVRYVLYCGAEIGFNPRSAFSRASSTRPLRSLSQQTRRVSSDRDRLAADGEQPLSQTASPFAR